LQKKQRGMTTIVGIFDEALDVEKSVERLAASGFEDTVYDEAIVAEHPGGDSVRPVRAAGSGPDVALGGDAPNLLPKLDRNEIVRAFKAKLGRYGLPQEVIAGYATAFLHNGKFVIVQTEDARAEEAMKILRQAGATRVNRH
jgi:hypothetical protein